MLFKFGRVNRRQKKLKGSSKRNSGVNGFSGLLIDVGEVRFLNRPMSSQQKYLVLNGLSRIAIARSSYLACIHIE